MNTKLFIGLIVMLLSVSACASISAPVSHFSVTVVGEDGAPVEGVKVVGGFSNNKRDYVPGPDIRGITNAEGKVNISGPAYFYVDVYATKDGYYKSMKRVPINIVKDQDVSFVLRSKRNPIGLYAKNFKGYIPKNKTIISFDFEKGDWVSPFGKGTREDIYFYYDGYSNSYFEFEGKLKIGFLNEFDGLIDIVYKNGAFSELKLPYMAPKNGYRNTKLLIYGRKGKGSSAYYESNLNKKGNFGYFFRIHSEKDSDGKIIRANYVKVGGDIMFDPRAGDKGAAYIEMTYYYNPAPNDRNLEFNTKQNLYKNLTNLEKVRAP